VAREQRKLAAILAADVVGYSRLMGRDESGTLARLRKNRGERLDPVLAKYNGRLVKLTGDGALIEFASAFDALSAAIEFQQAMTEANSDRPADAALVFRVGLHLGDLIVEGDDLYGDGVNVAARLEGEAPAGGILISRNVRDAVAGRVNATFEDLGGVRRQIKRVRTGLFGREALAHLLNDVRRRFDGSSSVGSRWCGV
jgi:adenylate cyclase